MYAADMIEKTRAADESDVMHVAIKRLAGHDSGGRMVTVASGRGNDDDGSRVMAAIIVNIIVWGIVIIIMTMELMPARAVVRVSPVALNGGTRDNPDVRLACPPRGGCKRRPACQNLRRKPKA